MRRTGGGVGGGISVRKTIFCGHLRWYRMNTEVDAGVNQSRHTGILLLSKLIPLLYTVATSCPELLVLNIFVQGVRSHLSERPRREIVNRDHSA